MTINIKRSWMHAFVALIWGTWFILEVFALIAGYPMDHAPFTFPAACLVITIYAAAAWADSHERGQ